LKLYNQNSASDLIKIPILILIRQNKNQAKQTLSKNFWKSLKSNHIYKNGYIIRKTFNKEQNNEYDLIKKLSEKFIVDNYHRNPTFHHISKTSNGYAITKHCEIKQKVNCIWNIYISIDKNEAILTCNKEFEHIKSSIKVYF
jgi:hypothetical protein